MSSAKRERGSDDAVSGGAAREDALLTCPPPRRHSKCSPSGRATRPLLRLLRAPPSPLLRGCV